MKSVLFCLIASLATLPAAALFAAGDTATVYTLGHAAVKIDVAGVRIYIDPYNLGSPVADADIILVTHEHSDHLSVSTINSIRKPSTVIYATAACKNKLSTQANLHIVAPGDSAMVGDIRIDVVHAYSISNIYHPYGRSVGYVVSANGIKFYHAGDTETIPEMKDIYCDVAFLPLGQVTPEAAVDVHARIAIPVHWGLFEGTLADAQAFAAALSGRVEVVISPNSGLVVTALPDNAGMWRATAAGRFAGAGSGAGLVWRHVDTGAHAMWLFDGTVVAGAASLTGEGPWDVVRTGDFDGSGTDDLLWRNSSTGEHALWLLNGLTVGEAGVIYNGGTGWTVSTTGDFNGDGRADLVWRNDADGAHALWLLNGVSVGDGATIWTGGGGWTAGRSGDLDGDGRSDLVWENDSTGGVAAWLVQGTAASSGAILFEGGGDWSLADVADFDGDARVDLLWRRESTGTCALWLMNGLVPASSGTIYDSGTEWVVDATADFNGDGRADILWRSTVTGDRAIWLMDGLGVAAGGTIGNASSGWVPEQCADFNHDGKADILWLDEATGAQVLWLVDGTTVPAVADVLPGSGD